MKKIVLIVVCVLWLLAGVQVIQSREEDKQEKIMEVLGRVGTMEQVTMIEYEGILLETIQEKSAFIEEIRAITGGGDIKVSDSETGEKQYLFISLEVPEGVKDAFAVREKLDRMLSPYVRTLQSSVNVIGSLKGELSLERRNQAADELLRELEAEVVTEYRSMELFTIYGYTPYIEEYKLQKNQAVNVNIAMYYNEEEDRTYIYAAVPVIGVEY